MAGGGGQRGQPWTISLGCRNGRRTIGKSRHARLAARLFRQGLPAVERFTSPRAWSFTLLGLDGFSERFPGDDEAVAMRALLTDRLLELWKSPPGEDWPWPEEILSYDNARLCQALILSGRKMTHPEAVASGLRSLEWLAKLQKAEAGHFRPIGSNGFYTRGVSGPASTSSP